MILRVFTFLTFASSLFATSGCSVFIGNVKPVEKKSEEYRIMDLTQYDPSWVQLDPRNSSGDSAGSPKAETSTFDIGFESKKTASIISINSACRSYEVSEQRRDLRQLSMELFFGLSDRKIIEEGKIDVNGILALKMTVHGNMNQDEMSLQSVVLEKDGCVYDLVFISRPRYFKSDLEAFTKFVHSLRLR